MIRLLLGLLIIGNFLNAQDNYLFQYSEKFYQKHPEVERKYFDSDKNTYVSVSDQFLKSEGYVLEYSERFYDNHPEVERRYINPDVPGSRNRPISSVLSSEVEKYYKKQIKFSELSKESKDKVLNDRREYQKSISPNKSRTKKEKILLSLGVLTAAYLAYELLDDDAIGGGGGNYGNPLLPYYTTESYHWDQFYGLYNVLIWRCRTDGGPNAGQFAENSRCAGQIKTDTRWPNKRAP